MNHAVAMMNNLGGQIDEIFGLPPRRGIIVPQPNYFSGNVDNSINIADSVVGVVNAGTVKNLNNSLNNVSVNNPELAARLVVLSHRIATKKELTQEAKEEGLEALTFLSEQAQKPENERNKSMIKSAGKAVRSTLSLAADLMTLSPLVTSVIKDLI
ncbi:hypothetical protein HYS42_01620 [Candidatus Saccharibacteria bacterium]|nr:hypothetical protein [Candidatus Saccharibacteria bacterium]